MENVKAWGIKKKVEGEKEDFWWWDFKFDEYDSWGLNGTPITAQSHVKSLAIGADASDGEVVEFTPTESRTTNDRLQIALAMTLAAQIKKNIPNINAQSLERMVDVAYEAALVLAGEQCGVKRPRMGETNGEA